MKLKEIYRFAVQMGMEKDVRGLDELRAAMAKRQKDFTKCDEKDRRYFDQESITNPFGDTRILYGTGEEEIKSALVGVDMESAEIVLADRLREKGMPVDLVIAHHPEGVALAALAEVMELQSDLLHRMGIPINVAESILASRISEVERGILPTNHQRAVDAARLLSMPFMCVHTAADNMVNDFLQTMVNEQQPRLLDDVVEMLLSIPEYSQAKEMKAGPRIVVGDKRKRAGRIFVDMTGGTSGSAEAYAKMETAGVGTILCMHLSEKHRESAKKSNINVIIAGHMASDSLGLNLVMDQMEAKGLNIIPCSGYIRISRAAGKKAAAGKRGKK